MYFDPRGEKGVGDGGNVVRKTRSLFGDRGAMRGAEASNQGVMEEIKAHAEIICGRKGGSSWSSVENAERGVMVSLISWIALSEHEMRVGRDGEGGWSSWRRIFITMSPERLGLCHCGGRKSCQSAALKLITKTG